MKKEGKKLLAWLVTLWAAKVVICHSIFTFTLRCWWLCFFVLYSVMMSWICSLYVVFVCTHQSESLNSHISILLYNVYLYYIRFVILLFGFARWKNKEEKGGKQWKLYFFQPIAPLYGRGNMGQISQQSTYNDEN